DVRILKKSYHILKQVMYDRRVVSFSGTTDLSDLSIPRVEILYTNYKTFPRGTFKDRFLLSNYIKKTQAKLEVSDSYKDYELIMQNIRN
uniref:hypothetical protein n=1 Tax=Aureivirga marina TaxID=1182451 RepID=UPI001E2FB98B